MKMQLLVPIVTELAGGKLAEYGLPNVMMGTSSSPFFLSHCVGTANCLKPLS